MSWVQPGGIAVGPTGVGLGAAVELGTAVGRAVGLSTAVGATVGMAVGAWATALGDETTDGAVCSTTGVAAPQPTRPSSIGTMRSSFRQRIIMILSSRPETQRHKEQKDLLARVLCLKFYSPSGFFFKKVYILPPQTGQVPRAARRPLSVSSSCASWIRRFSWQRVQ